MFPYKINELDSGTNKELLEWFEGAEGGFCQTGPQKWLLPSTYIDHADKYYSMPILDDDIWIVTFPRSGTTICQELVWLLNNNCDFREASKRSLECRVPFYEFQLIHSKKAQDEIASLNGHHPLTLDQFKIWNEPGYEIGQRLKAPRIFKTHLPFGLLPQDLQRKGKTLYVARHPKDVALSFFHHNRLINLHKYKGDFNRYWDYFERDLTLWSPYWEHVKEAWKLRDNPHILFIFFEELIMDLSNTIRKMANFYKKPVTEDQIQQLVSHLQIDNFRQNVKLHKHMEYVKGFHRENEESFVRKGKVNTHNEFSPEIAKRADEWVERNLAKTDMRFPVVNRRTT